MEKSSLSSSSYVSNPMLCIPRVDVKLSTNFIFKILCYANFGKIIKIIEIPLKSDENYKRIIIKLQWYEKNEFAREVKEKIINGKSIKLVYNMPWFWKIVLLRNNETINS